jgi:hypothetical protein
MRKFKVLFKKLSREMWRSYIRTYEGAPGARWL